MIIKLFWLAPQTDDWGLPLPESEFPPNLVPVSEADTDKLGDPLDIALWIFNQFELSRQQDRVSGWRPYIQWEGGGLNGVVACRIDEAYQRKLKEAGVLGYQTIPLKPCPLCGGEASCYMDLDPGSGTMDLYSFIECDGCGFGLRDIYRGDSLNAIAKWGRRVGPRPRQRRMTRKKKPVKKEQR